MYVMYLFILWNFLYLDMNMSCVQTTVTADFKDFPWKLNKNKKQKITTRECRIFGLLLIPPERLFSLLTMRNGPFQQPTMAVATATVPLNHTRVQIKHFAWVAAWDSFEQFIFCYFLPQWFTSLCKNRTRKNCLMRLRSYFNFY